MMTKIKMLLVSFGYRKINENMYIKPIGFIGMVAEIKDGVLTFFSDFINKHGERSTWDSRQLDISLLSEMDFDKASYEIARAEEEVYHKVYGNKPCNTITSAEILMIEQGIM